MSSNLAHVSRHDLAMVGIGAVAVVPWMIVQYMQFHSLRFLLLFAVLFAGAVALYACYDRLRAARVPELPFLLSLIVLGALFMVYFTPGTVPDEPSHFWSSYGLANYLLGQPVHVDLEALTMRSCDVALKLNDTVQLTANAYAKAVRNFAWLDTLGTTEIAPVPALSLDYATNVIWFKLPSALAIVLARLLGLGAYPLFYLGRISNYAVFVALVYVAVRLAPAAKAGFRAVALLPMTLHVAMSYSYDAEVIGLALMVSALGLRLITGEGPCPRRELIALPVCLVLLAPCKLVYSVLALMVLAVPATRFSSKRAAWTYRIVVLGVTALSVLALRASALLTVAGVGPGTPALDERGEETGTFYALSDFVRDPVGMIKLVMNTLITQGDFYLSSMVGGTLTWFDARLEAPWYLVGAVLAILALAWVRSTDEERLRLAQRVLFVGIGVLGFGAIVLSMCVGWTFNTETVIQGVQGRYFIPLLPVACWALVRGGGVVASYDTARGTLAAMVVVNLMNLMRIVAIASTTFQ